MALHKLSPGQKVIASLCELGEALGYLTKTEALIEDRATGPAVDVGWYSDENQNYPLIIFEVESVASNSMANNATKVYGQPSQHFARPHCFFHLILRSGDETSRIDSLRNIFGSHNYTAMQLSDATATGFLKDILQNHRRIRGDLNLAYFLWALTRFPFASDVKAVIDYAADLNFQGYYLDSLAALAREHEDKCGLYLHNLNERVINTRWAGTDGGYTAYMGAMWAEPIEIAMLAAGGLLHIGDAMQRLVEWQENPKFGLARITAAPHVLGRSRAYDEFILGVSGAFWGLLAALFIAHPEALNYISMEAAKIAIQLSDATPEFWLHSYAWSLNITASAGDYDLFDELRQIANTRGGVPAEALYCPLFVVSPDDDNRWRSSIQKDIQAVPSMSDFIEQRKMRYQSVEPISPVRVAAGVITSEDLAPYASPIISLLSRASW